MFTVGLFSCQQRQRGERERDMKSRCFALAVMCLVAINEAQNSPQDFLAAHNTARSLVGVGPMSWDTTVATYASNYAIQRVGDCTLMHSGGRYGENLFSGSGGEFSATDAVNAWVSEKQYYDYGSNSCASGKVCGHYTQVVWRNSTRLGCARKVCKNGNIFITCNYDPPGNYVGERPYSSDNISQNKPQDYLDSHNAARSVVGVGPLRWSNTVAAYAQNYANQRIGDCNLIHSNGPYGENIFWGSSVNFTAVDAVNAWVAEKLYYDYDSNTCASGQQCGHYTQVVWGNSISLGCARVTCNTGGVFTTCNYDPPGNYNGQRPYESAQDYLEAHNTVRSHVGVGPLSWNTTVAAYAQNHAKKRVGNCSLTHSGGSYGENVFLGSAYDVTAVDAVNSWVAEKQYYDYDSNSCASGQQCGHYTQVVWGKSVRLGCARVMCNSGGILITCNYDPPGNYVGQRPYVSDVFSFGVLLLEIVSGRSNRGFYDNEHSLNLLDHAWMLWNETRSLELLDPSIGDSCSTSEVLISIQVGLLCVQESATDRPDMASIVSMLTSETACLPQPGKPAFSSGGTVVETEAPPVGQRFCSINEVIVSVLEPR